MIKSIVLSTVTLLSGHTSTFYQQEIDLPQGITEIRSEMPWNSVALFSPEGKEIPKLYYENDKGQWSPWYADDEDPAYLELLHTGDVQHTLKIKSAEPVRVVAHFFDTSEPRLNRLVASAGTMDDLQNLVARFDPFDDQQFAENPVLQLLPKLDIDRPKYISREDWGADESLRIWTNGPENLGFGYEPGKKCVGYWFCTAVNQLGLEYHPKLIKHKSENGEALNWPIAENSKVAKIIIHHTGEYVKEERDPMEVMRAIYYYHTVTRGWGDIGYNYVIDQKGNIYEGRAGGYKSVGAHVMYHNVGTLGVSLMGNFQHEEPTEPQLKVLALLLADHANRFKIDPMEQITFLGSHTYTITGHRQVARKGHGTACPGKNVISRLPDIREAVDKIMQVLKYKDKENATLGLDFLNKSSAAPNFQQFKKFQRPEKEAQLTMTKKIIPRIIMTRDSQKSIEITLENNTKHDWAWKSRLDVKNVPEGMLVPPFRSENPIKAGSSGTFSTEVTVRNAPNGLYKLQIYPTFLEDKFFDEVLDDYVFHYEVQVSGDKDIFVTKKKLDMKKLQANVFKKKAPDVYLRQLKTETDIDSNTTSSPLVKVKLSKFNKTYATLAADAPIKILDENEKVLGEIKDGEPIKVITDSTNRKKELLIRSNDKEWKTSMAKFRTNGILEIQNYSRGIGSVPYNKFRHQLNLHPIQDDLILVVNELPIEEYLWGLAEEPKTEPIAKKHAIHVLARSYALVYSQEHRRKFKTPLYDLEDDPASSQFYLGYDWERYHNYQKDLVDATHGLVITYHGNPVIGPYFTQSAGQSSDKWRTQYPWTKSQPLPYDRGLEAKGHGVGLSGNTARELANKGKNYLEILEYFFDDIKVEKAY